MNFDRYLDAPEATAWDYIESALDDLRDADSAVSEAMGCMEELKNNSYLLAFADAIVEDILTLKTMLKAIEREIEDDRP
jgi:hypothetical protein